MKYKNMAKEMTDEEVQIALWTFVVDAIVTKIERNIEQNEIYVTFYLDAAKDEKEYTVTFWPHKPGDIPDDLETTQLYEDYEKFMVAKGYHTLWLGNVFV